VNGAIAAGSDAGRRATLLGAAAILLWSALAPLTTATGGVPPFELVGLAFALAFVLGLAKRALLGEPLLAHLRQPWSAWLLGVGGLFGYHFFYFVALRTAPPVAANLINYLWPLLIVLFSALLPGERLRWWHVAGAAAGLAGTALLVTGGDRFSIAAADAPGYAAAFACAFTWAGYSVLNRRLGAVPTDAVGGFCGATSALAFLCHFLLEPAVWPAGMQWFVVLAIGLGPTGAAFFLWDYGVKRGDIRALGAFSYAAPLLSTLLLIALGRGTPSAALGVACLLIVGGALLASRGLWRRPS
jgi:drug/metabolite transporter (DMT)-like permease